MVFGKASSFGTNLNLSNIDGTNGFQINGVLAGDFSGSSVSSAGDVNGDGFDDILIGAPYSNPNDNNSGTSYVVFGRASGFDPTFELFSLDGVNGFRIEGDSEHDAVGRSVSSIGDMNGDGVGDFIVGAMREGDSFEGAAYVVMGKTTGWAETLDLSSLDGGNGFKLEGGGTADYAGFCVSSAGDVNGDGFDDVIVGTLGTDDAYVVFGKPVFLADIIQLSGLNGQLDSRSSATAAIPQAILSILQATSMATGLTTSLSAPRMRSWPMSCSAKPPSVPGSGSLISITSPPTWTATTASSLSRRTGLPSVPRRAT